MANVSSECPPCQVEAPDFFTALSAWWEVEEGPLTKLAFAAACIALAVVLVGMFCLLYRCGSYRGGRKAAHRKRFLQEAEPTTKEPATQEVDEEREAKAIAKRVSGLEGDNVENDLKVKGQRPKTVVKAPKEGQGTYIGEYQVFKEIGSGAYGTVYLVKRDQEEELYALKSIHVKKASVMKMALQETAVLKSLQHDNIVAYIDAFEEKSSKGKAMCIVMEFCKHGELTDLLKKTKVALSEEGVMVWFAKLVDALGYIHQRDIVHRDLKPDNIFVSETYDLKIGDFGVATNLTPDHTQTITTAGTPVYMAPEVIQKQKYGTKADVWSLGVILYRLASRKELTSIVCLDVASGKLKGMLKDIPKEYSADMHYFISFLLEVDPGKRPSIEDLKSDAVFLAWELILFFENNRFKTADKTFPDAVVPALLSFLGDDRAHLRMETRTNAFSVLAHLLVSGEHQESRCKMVTRDLHKMVSFIEELDASNQLAGLSVLYVALSQWQPNVYAFCADGAAGIPFLIPYLSDDADLKTLLTALSIIKQTLMLDLPSQVTRNQNIIRDCGLLARLVALLKHELPLVTYETARVLFFCVENVAGETKLASQRGACTFVATRREQFRHATYVCGTCTSAAAASKKKKNLKEKLTSKGVRPTLVCGTCAEACHLGHDLLPRGSVNHFCDCGSGHSAVRCECLGMLDVATTVNVENQTVASMATEVVPFMVEQMESPNPTAMSVYLRLLFAALYENEVNQAAFVEANGVAVITASCLPTNDKHPESTVLAVAVLIAAMNNNDDAVAAFLDAGSDGDSAVPMLLTMLEDRSDVALPIGVLRLLETLLGTKSKKMSGVKKDLKAKVKALSLQAYCSDELLKVLSLSRGDATIDISNFSFFKNHGTTDDSNESETPISTNASAFTSAAGSDSDEDDSTEDEDSS